MGDSYYSGSGGAPMSLPVSGYYMFTSPNVPTTNSGVGNGNLRVSPWWLPSPLPITRIGCEVTSAGDSGATLKLAIYADNGSYQPGSLLLDSSVSGSSSTSLGNGLINANSATVQEITVSYTVPAGLVWVGGVIQGVVTTQPTMRVLLLTGGAPFILPTGTSLPPANTASAQSWANTGITGALPATFVVNASPSTIAPRIFVKAA